MEIVLHVPKSKLSRRKVPLFRNLPSISRASNRMAVTDLRFSWEAIVRCQGLDPRNSRTKPSWDFPDPVFQTSNSAILWDFNRSLVLLSKRIIFSLLTPSNLAFYKKENIYFDNQIQCTCSNTYHKFCKYKYIFVEHFQNTHQLQLNQVSVNSAAIEVAYIYS